MRYFCKVGALPLQVKADSWEIQPGVKSPWKKLACGMAFVLFFGNTLYKNLSLLYGFLSTRDDIPLYQTVIHMILAGTANMMAFSSYVLYIQYPGTYATFAGMTLAGNVTGSKRTNLYSVLLLVD